MAAFAGTEDMTAIWRTMTESETARAEELLLIASDMLRVKAAGCGIDLDGRATASEAYSNVLKSVVVNMVSRELLTSTSAEPMETVTQSALGYSYSGTYLNPGGGLFIKKSELSLLGLRRQRISSIDMTGGIQETGGVQDD